MKIGNSRRGPRGLVLALLACMTTGCAISSIKEGSPLPETGLRLLKVGMPKSEVLDLFGPPEEFRRPELLDILMSETVAPETIDPSAAIFNDIFTYRYTDGDIKIFTVILFTWMATDIKSDDLVVFFDESDQVKYFSFRRGTSGAGPGE